MSVTANPQASRGIVWLASGIIAGIAFTGYIVKPAPVAHAAPVAVAGAIDYKAITEAVRAGFPAAPVAAPARAVPAPVAAPAPVRAKRKLRKVHTATQVLYYVPVHRCGCGW
jgi:hypothetical protein